MSLPQLRVFTFAMIRGLLPLGVAQILGIRITLPQYWMIRGLLPLGVAQFLDSRCREK
ncbi:hypothetical protein [Nostoc sp. CENA543]|uniref:hypothetical protein n=1 Tax=Nostoc sp. CENA543 TaxID=1869241 RepID=UPI0012FFEB30|nr:hypothetical protein [Nostoc sp. CENA543]